MAVPEKSLSDEQGSLVRQAYQSAADYTEFVMLLDGMFPGDAIDLVGENRFASEANKSPIEGIGFDSFLYSHWNFSDTSNAAIAACIEANERTLFAGTPNAFSEFNGNKILIDLDQADDRFPNQVRADFNVINAAALSRSFDCLVMDPPWSAMDYRNWLHIAIEIMSAGGKLIIPLFQSHTRPGADTERESIIKALTKSRFEVTVLTNHLSYKTPSFERMMLRRRCLPEIDWRRADLIIATRPRSAELVESSGIVKAHREVRSPPVKRLIFRDGSIDVALLPGRLLPTPPNDFSNAMITPSSRDPSTRACNVFSSDGYRFRVEDPFDLLSRLVGIDSIEDSKALISKIGSSTPP